MISENTDREMMSANQLAERIRAHRQKDVYRFDELKGMIADIRAYRHRLDLIDEIMELEQSLCV